MKKYRTHEDYLTKALKNPKEAALYMNEAVEEENFALMLSVLAQLVKVSGVSKTAKKISLSRTGVYKTLSKKGNPNLKTFVSLLHASGLQMSFKPTHLQHTR